MKDVNDILCVKLYQLLNGVISAPVYNKYIVGAVDLQAYVLITTVNHNDVSTMVSANTLTSFQLSIYTKDSSANPGRLVNTIAGEIYSLIYPQPNSLIDLEPELQNAMLKLVGDNSPPSLNTGNAIFINRFLTFQAQIYHKD